MARLFIEDDDFLDGCSELESSEDVTPDENAPYHALFAPIIEDGMARGMIDRSALQRRAEEWHELFGGHDDG